MLGHASMQPVLAGQPHIAQALFTDPELQEP
jgi:hypothetical protein